MFHPEFVLHLQHRCQQHWIAEAIRYTHRKGVEALFAAQTCAMSGQMKPRVHLIDWPEFPTVNRLQTQKQSITALAQCYIMRVH